MQQIIESRCRASSALSTWPTHIQASDLIAAVDFEMYTKSFKISCTMISGLSRICQISESCLWRADTCVLELVISALPGSMLCRITALIALQWEMLFYLILSWTVNGDLVQFVARRHTSWNWLWSKTAPNKMPGACARSLDRGPGSSQIMHFFPSIFYFPTTKIPCH